MKGQREVFAARNSIFQNHLQVQLNFYHVKYLGVNFNRNVKYRNHAEAI